MYLCSAADPSEIRQTLLASSTHPLWPRFLDLIIPVLGNFTPSPQLELEYVAEALWPVYTRNLPDHLEQNLLGRPYPDPANPPPQLQISIKLLTDLKHAMAVPLAVASEELLTRKIGITNFADSLKRAGGAGATPSRFAGITAKTIGEGGLAADLGFCSKVLVVAAYCASYNPPKSDQRLFGRIGTDGKRRRGGARRAGYGRTRVGKVSRLCVYADPLEPADMCRSRNGCSVLNHSPLIACSPSSPRCTLNTRRAPRTSFLLWNTPMTKRKTGR